jgi:hypothetical protein
VIQAQETVNAQGLIGVDYKMEMTQESTVYKIMGIAITYEKK